MDSVIVTVAVKNNSYSCDLEIPSNVPVSELFNMIVEGLNLKNKVYDTTYKNQIYAEPLGRLLEANETLEVAGVWDGSILTIL